jgi:RNA polymerase nonessential primary-like sigma factor
MSCEDYLKDISRVPLLTAEEEITLGNKVQTMIRLLNSKGISQQMSAANMTEILEILDRDEITIIKAGLKARNRMVAANMRLVVAIAKKYAGKNVHMSIQDLIQEGAIGLTRAAEKFDPARGYKFSTYAYLWIKQGMTRGAESQEATIKLPAHIQRIIRKAGEIRLRLIDTLGREPSFQEISEAMGESSHKKMREIIAMSPVVISSDIRVANRSDSHGEELKNAGSLMDMVGFSQEASSGDEDTLAERLQFVMMAIQALDPVDRMLITCKYGIDTEPASTKQLSELTGMTPQAVRERQQAITQKIRYVVTRFTMSIR